MAKYADRGESYGRLKVIDPQVQNRNGHRYSLCRCDCGIEKLFADSNLINGKTKSCGCLAKETTSRVKKTHGMSGSKIYMVWNRMLTRCYNEKVERYPRYGGRGITVCDRWRSFESFYKDMGDIPAPGYSLGRIDNDGNYGPGNCRWETAKEQGWNKSGTVRLDHNGESLSIAEWADRTGLGYSKIMQRVRRGEQSDNVLSPEDRCRKCITVDGITDTTTGWMRRAEIPISSFYHHRRKGISPVDIVKIYLSKGRA